MIEQLFGKFVNVYCYTVYTVCLTKKNGYKFRMYFNFSSVPYKNNTLLGLYQHYSDSRYISKLLGQLAKLYL